MKFTSIALAAAIGLTQASAETVQGFDISNHQSTVDYKAAYNDGARFVMIKATEGTGYVDTSFSKHYQGATDAKMLRGGYHFALPNKSSGAKQARYFISHGGGWTDDGLTLPGMLDIEYNPYGSTCYGLSASAMVSWIKEFVTEYHKATGIYPMIYSTADWWKQCTGDAGGFGDTCPLVLAAYSSSAPSTIPGDWPTYTIWQNSDKYKHGGDSDLFNGGLEQLKKIAKPE
ncbi:glycoside hydrolase superfamily [Aspergillus avenaceus]|uniref:N,O-diacetylmuramidase n=1 Tax=Aspergillus avenaceus TaxID=36643 RepID=A0A5N6TL82_ASPAV|nr:glycoside hydrolase superfamily [Aspergillus avenaceus]